VGDSRLRVYLYHIPQVSGVPIQPETIVRLADTYPGIIEGVKDSGADFSHTAALVKRLPQLSVLTGYEPHLPSLMKRGCAGTICGVANLWPSLIAALLTPGESQGDELRVQAFLDIVHPYSFVPALKAILASQTGDPTWCAVRPPLLPLTEAERKRLILALEQAGLRFAAGR
jgi:4-hydroxy-tetrahydrodipicolinate synthase